MKLGFGNYHAWQWFNEQFPCFVEKHAALEVLRDKIFVGKFQPTHHADYIIFGLGRVCVEDFEQILNLCGNGFGIGAMQIVRGMYERQVTAAFISKYPDEVDRFTAYDAVHMNKTVNQLKEVYAADPEILNRIVSEEERAKIAENYNAIKDNFMRVKCEECETTEPMFSWHKYDIPTMALKGHQPALKDLMYYQYFRPLLFAHSTFKSVEARVVFKDDASFSFESDGQRNYIKEALVYGHHLLLHVFDLQNKHFKLRLDRDLETCESDYLECWTPDEAGEGSKLSDSQQ